MLVANKTVVQYSFPAYCDERLDWPDPLPVLTYCGTTIMLVIEQNYRSILILLHTATRGSADAETDGWTGMTKL